MPIDLGSFGESLGRGLGEIPPVAIALTILAGPTLLFIGYRLVSVARRMQPASDLEAEPFWVCHDCRSVNELRHTHCYRCGLARDAVAEIEVIVDQPTAPPARFDVPAGSPFAAIAANPMGLPDVGPGVPVMADRSAASDATAVGPGRAAHPVAVPVVAEDSEALLLADVPHEAAGGHEAAPADAAPADTAQADAAPTDTSLEPALERQQ